MYEQDGTHYFVCGTNFFFFFFRKQKETKHSRVFSDILPGAGTCTRSAFVVSGVISSLATSRWGLQLVRLDKPCSSLLSSV